MVPFYLIGNLHCAGMCGPLVLMLGSNRWRHFYFLGRTLSYSLACLLAGEAGYVLHSALQHYHLTAIASFFFGGIISAIGFYNLAGKRFKPPSIFFRRLSPLSKNLSLLLLHDQPWPSFLFGFFTVLLPCGQTMVVFSACALYGDPVSGLANGIAFSLLTSPSLWLSMRAQGLLGYAKKHYNLLLGVSSVAVGALAFCRGLAEVGIIPHLILNPKAPAYYHIVIY